MPILYESTEELVSKGITLKFSPSPDLGTMALVFVAGIFIGFVVLPIALPIVGYQVTKRWGP